MLTAMCRKLKLKTTGKKEELSDRLMSYLKSSPSSSSSVSSSKASSTSSSASKTKAEPPVIRNLKEAAVQYTVTKNRWGNYEHVATRFVFVNKIVVGKQLDNGEIAPLTLDDIERCKREKLSYKQPEKLVSDKDTAIENIKLDEEDEEEEELLEDEIEMEDEAAEEDDEDDK